MFIKSKLQQQIWSILQKNNVFIRQNKKSLYRWPDLGSDHMGPGPGANFKGSKNKSYNSILGHWK